MQSSEFPLFDALLRQLGGVFGKKVDDDMAQSYWRALQDQSFGSVRKYADKHTRNSKFFPKPAELRPKDEKPISGKPDPTFDEALARNKRNLDEWLLNDPEIARIELGIAKVGRILAVDHPGSPQYAEALREDRQLRDMRRTVWEQRA